MIRAIYKTIRDLGDMGEHELTVDAVIGEFPYISQCTATVGDKVIDLTPMIRKDLANMILEEITINERDYRREQAEDRKLDAYLERAA